jgi:hypothetical protein
MVRNAARDQIYLIDLIYTENWCIGLLLLCNLHIENQVKSTSTLGSASVYLSYVNSMAIFHSRRTYARILSLYMAIQPFGPWPLFQFLNPIHRQ